jgi:hypothetical protein
MNFQINHSSSIPMSAVKPSTATSAPSLKPEIQSVSSKPMSQEAQHLIGRVQTQNTQTQTSIGSSSELALLKNSVLATPSEHISLPESMPKPSQFHSSAESIYPETVFSIPEHNTPSSSPPITIASGYLSNPNVSEVQTPLFETVSLSSEPLYPATKISLTDESPSKAATEVQAPTPVKAKAAVDSLHTPTHDWVEHAPTHGPLAPIQLPDKYAHETETFGWRALMGYDMEKLQKENPNLHAKLLTLASARNATEFNTALKAMNLDVSQFPFKTTKYFTPEEITAHTLSPKQGQLTDSTQTTVKQLESSVYAMGMDGQIVTNLSGKQMIAMPDTQNAFQTIHHSTMLSGKEVLHAGHLSVKDGKVTYLDDDSGHYRPDAAHTHEAFQKLVEKGVLDPNAQTGRVKLVDKTREKGLNRVDDKHVSVHFSAYQQSQGNEKGIRAKQNMLQELQSKTTQRKNVLDQNHTTGSKPIDPPPVPPSPEIQAASSSESESSPSLFSLNQGSNVEKEAAYPAGLSPNPESSSSSPPLFSFNQGSNVEKEVYPGGIVSETIMTFLDSDETPSK